MFYTLLIAEKEYKSPYCVPVVISNQVSYPIFLPKYDTIHKGSNCASRCTTVPVPVSSDITMFLGDQKV